MFGFVVGIGWFPKPKLQFLAETEPNRNNGFSSSVLVCVIKRFLTVKAKTLFLLINKTSTVEELTVFGSVLACYFLLSNNPKTASFG